MPDYYLAQLNIAQARAPMDSPELADFVANIERINTLAERSDGFIWRMVDEEEQDTSALNHFGQNLLINLSLWRDVAALRAFVYDSEHISIMRRRKEWFIALPEAAMVLWWVPSDRRPSLTEAAAKLSLLRAEGPKPQAFSFRNAFPPPE